MGCGTAHPIAPPLPRRRASASCMRMTTADVAPSASLRIAVCNLQSGIGTTRGYWQYLTTGWKYWLPHDSNPILEAARFLREARIDLALVNEIEGGSRRS